MRPPAGGSAAGLPAATRALPPNTVAALVAAAARALAVTATVVAAAALLIELAVVLVSILGRSLAGHAPLWSDEASRLALSVITFIGGAAAYRGAHHTAIRLVT